MNVKFNLNMNESYKTDYNEENKRARGLSWLWFLHINVQQGGRELLAWEKASGIKAQPASFLRSLDYSYFVLLLRVLLINLVNHYFRSRSACDVQSSLSNADSLGNWKERPPTRIVPLADTKEKNYTGKEVRLREIQGEK